MDAHTIKLVLCLTLFISVQGNSQACDKSSIQIQQTNIGKSSNRLDFIFEVEVKNLCTCTVKSVFVNSLGFASSMQVDLKLFKREGDSYLVNDGQPIASQSSVKFQYAWTHYFVLTPASFQSEC